MRTLRIGGLLSGVLALFAARGSATPAALDFSELAHNDSAIIGIGPTYSTHGFQLTDTAFPGSNNVPSFATPGALRFDYDGESSLYAGSAQDTITLTRGDGRAFAIFAIDLAELPNGAETGGPRPADGPFIITFTGHRSDGTTVIDVGTVDPFPSILTFHFDNEFSDLLSVAWQQGPGGTAPGLATHQFSNIQVDAVPEPSAILLLGTGFVGVFRERHRRRLVRNRVTKQ
jgi:hypothetical protein